MTKKILTKSDIQAEMQKQFEAIAKGFGVEGLKVKEPKITIDAAGNRSWTIESITGNGVSKDLGNRFAEIVFEYAKIVDLLDE